MKVTFELESCHKCGHRQGAVIFSREGCVHPQLVKLNSREYYGRLLPENLKIPDWCPLRHGGSYL